MPASVSASQLPTRDARLISDNDQAEARILQQPQTFHSSRQQLNLIDGGQVVLLDDDGAVAVEQDVGARCSL